MFRPADANPQDGSQDGGSTGNAGTTGGAFNGELSSGTVTAALTDSTEANRELAIVDISVPDATMVRLGKARSANRHPSGRVSFETECDRSASIVSVLRVDGNVDQLTPCSTATPELAELEFGLDFRRSELSPDGDRVLVQYRWYDDYFYTGMAVFEGGRLAHDYRTYGTGTWLDDQRLVLTRPDGLYIATLGQEAVPVSGERVDGPLHPSVSPDGSQIAFVRNQQIWAVGTDGSNLRLLVQGPDGYLSPTWSPDGRFIAFLRQTGQSSIHQSILLYDPENQVYHLVDLSPNLELFQAPAPPLSWR